MEVNDHHHCSNIVLCSEQQNLYDFAFQGLGEVQYSFKSAYWYQILHPGTDSALF